MSHTPGPWSAYPPEMLDSKNWSVQTDSGMTIVCGDDTQETEANAHLIAAAPELLGRLKAMVSGAECECDKADEEHPLCDICWSRQVIAKAEGRTNEAPSH